MPVYIGIDWSQTKHDVCYLNEAGASIARQVVAHSPEGFQKLDAQRQQLGLATDACLVGIESAPNLLIDSPMACGAMVITRSLSSRRT
jgi:transposase